MNRHNNFDLIRLLAALQVLVAHLDDHLGLDLPLVGVLSYFPGVIIFFAISGFLVYESYQRGPGIQFATNRMLRIYPGLWACLAFTAVSMAILGRLTDWLHPQILIWLGAHATFFQFYDNSYFASWGAGGVSGALWTICVELQFYVAVPILAHLLATRRASGMLLALGLLSLLANVVTQHFLPAQSIYSKMLRISLAPYLFYFLLGVAASMNWQRWRRYLEGKALAWATVYAVYVAVGMASGIRATYFPDHWQLIGVVLLTVLTFSCAFTAPSLGRRLLHDNDLSYGIYLYHMPVIGILIELGLRGVGWAAPLAALLTVVAAYLSWSLIEQPALAFKRRWRRQLAPG